MPVFVEREMSAAPVAQAGVSMESFTLPLLSALELLLAIWAGGFVNDILNTS